MSAAPLAPLPPFLAQSRSRIPAPVRNWLGSLLQGPPAGPRHRQRQACVFALSRIGDFVLGLSVVRLFAREFGPGELVIVVSPRVAELAALELPGVELITLPAEAPGLLSDILPLWWRERRRFASDRFARRIALTHLRSLYQEIALSWAEAGTDHVLGFTSYPAAISDGQCRELQAHRLVASAVLGRNVAWEEIMPRFTRFPVGDDGRLLVYPLSHDGSRDFPADRVVAILRRWRTRSKAPVVFGGAPRDTGMLQRYAAACHVAGLDQVTIETPAGVVALVSHLGAAGAILSADSAAGHIGGAFDKPTVVLTTPEWHGFSQPWRKTSRQRGFLQNASDDEIAATLPGPASRASL